MTSDVFFFEPWANQDRLATSDIEDAPVARDPRGARAEPVSEPASVKESTSIRSSQPAPPQRWQSPPVPVERLRPSSVKRERALPHPTSDPPESADQDRPSPLAMELRERLVPRVKEVAIRLQASRHRTLLDDRLNRVPAVLRFRLAPRRGPFGDAAGMLGSVLEIAVLDETVVSVRHWLDPLADQPSEEYRVMAGILGPAWVDGVLLEFVERVLGSD